MLLGKNHNHLRLVAVRVAVSCRLWLHPIHKYVYYPHVVIFFKSKMLCRACCMLESKQQAEATARLAAGVVPRPTVQTVLGSQVPPVVISTLGITAST